MSPVTQVHVLLLCCPGMGHVNPMLQLGNTMSRTEGVVCKCTIIIPVARVDCEKFHAVRSDRLRISYLYLPGAGITTSFEYFAAHAPEIAQKVSQNVLRNVTVDIDERLEDIIQEAGSPECDQGWSAPDIVVSDMFVFWGRDVAHKLNVPYWVFMPSPLPAAYLFCSLPTDQAVEFPPELEIPGLGTVTRDNLPVIDPSPALQQAFLKAFDSYNFSEGMLINDLEALYPAELVQATRPLKAGASWRKLFVGPLAHMDSRQELTDDHAAIKWLNDQPHRSVVFVALGSWCDLPLADVVELAHGLTMSGKRVLWAHRSKSTPNPFMPQERPVEESIDQDGLPTGYREAHKDRVCVLPWVPQTKVLSHPAVATFISHCGWNSTIEALHFGGIPIIGLPVGAEQGMNARFLSEHLGLGPRLWKCRDIDQLDRDKVCKSVIEVFANPKYGVNANATQAVVRAGTDVSRQSIKEFFDLWASNRVP